jgi:hypothetical protein
MLELQFTAIFTRINSINVDSYLLCYSGFLTSPKSPLLLLTIIKQPYAQIVVMNPSSKKQDTIYKGKEYLL